MTTRPVFSESRGGSGALLKLVARAAGKVLGQLALGEEPSVVGSDAECALVIQHDTVSRRHVEVTRRGGGVYVKDLGSKNGTKYNGSRIKEALVPVDGVLVLGEVE